MRSVRACSRRKLPIYAQGQEEAGHNHHPCFGDLFEYPYRYLADFSKDAWRIHRCRGKRSHAKITVPERI